MNWFYKWTKFYYNHKKFWANVGTKKMKIKIITTSYKPLCYVHFSEVNTIDVYNYATHTPYQMSLEEFIETFQKNYILQYNQFYIQINKEQILYNINFHLSLDCDLKSYNIYDVKFSSKFRSTYNDKVDEYLLFA